MGSAALLMKTKTLSLLASLKDLLEDTARSVLTGIITTIAYYEIAVELLKEVCEPGGFTATTDQQPDKSAVCI